MCPSLIEIGSKTAEKNSAQTDRQTDRQTDTTKIMVTWPWTNRHRHDHWPEARLCNCLWSWSRRYSSSVCWSCIQSSERTEHSQPHSYIKAASNHYLILLPFYDHYPGQPALAPHPLPQLRLLEQSFTATCPCQRQLVHSDSRKYAKVLLEVW